MKNSAAILCVLLALFLTDVASADNGLRTDINPALLYWQATAAMPDRAAQDHLFTNEWRGHALDEQFEKQIATYDNAFKLLRQAARQKAPCDWGYDLTQGPELLLPGLAKAKLLSQAARLRTRWHLEHGRPDDARDDLLAAFVLGRQVSKDGILISALVQVAIENILASGVAENWFRFSPETLQQIMDGLAAVPARGTMVQCVATERIAFKDWLTRKIQGLQAASRNEGEALQKTQELLRSIMSGEEAPQGPAPPTPEAIIQSAGSTTAGLLRKLKELDALYDEAAVLMTVPYDQFLPQIKAFNKKVANHPNLFVHVFFPVFEKCRLKEFAIEVKLAMLRAAVAYRRSGEAGLSQVADPLFNGSFQFRRFEFDGVDRGFELRSQMRYLDDWNASLIFLEKDGPAFHLDGKNAGKALK
ncbi:MAG: hypothetical protein HZA90_11295 [Verrucomicrobia bacterium]|nr:hypothetical protein [Verrucomicrobiota bacterium]